MDTNTDAKTFADALAVLKRYAGRGANRVKAAEWAELRVPDGGGTMVLRRWACFTGTDASASITAGGGTPGTVHVDAAALADAVKGLTGTLTFAADGERLTITGGAGSASLRIMDAADYPAASGYPLRAFATITDGEREALTGVLDAAAKGYDARAVLTGVYFDAEHGEAVATDTYRMAAARIRTLSGSGIIAADVLRVANATATGGMELHADTDGERYVLTYRVTKGTKKLPRTFAVTVYGRMIEGPFPNYAAIVAPARDDAEHTWTITDAAGTADVARSFADNRNTPLMLSAAAGNAVLASATYPENGTREASPPIVTDGKTDVFASIAFNPRYFADAVQHAGDGAPISFRDPMRAAYFDGGDRYALLMPMRVN